MNNNTQIKNVTVVITRNFKFWIIVTNLYVWLLLSFQNSSLPLHDIGIVISNTLLHYNYITVNYDYEFAKLCLVNFFRSLFGKYPRTKSWILRLHLLNFVLYDVRGLLEAMHPQEVINTTGVFIFLKSLKNGSVLNLQCCIYVYKVLNYLSLL